ncbi:MAG: helix-turn-helix transcriptional regulator [Gemmatimonadales bacterium]|jgi:DNA-binding PadR family transcriptional regulator|nr:MAG: helix-turn-helix transcriptional regulator [Gemmatimonadales bacterium]
MDAADFLPLAARDLLILTVLADAPLHGYGIIKAVESRSRSGVLLDPANLYRVLRRMREQGWIREADDSDERRRTHAITPLGREVVRAEVERLERLLREARPALSRGGAG